MQSTANQSPNSLLTSKIQGNHQKNTAKIVQVTANLLLLLAFQLIRYVLETNYQGINREVGNPPTLLSFTFQFPESGHFKNAIERPLIAQTV